MNLSKDAELLFRYVRENDEQAFTQIVARHIGLVFRTASRQSFGTALDAEDITQEVFVLLAQKAESLLRHPSLAGWLHAATCFTVCDMRRANDRRLRREKEVWLMHDFPPEEALSWERLSPVLDDALRTLDHEEREAVLLRYFEERSFHDIAQVFKVKTDTARMRVNRAVGKLKTALQQRGVKTTAAALIACLTVPPALILPSSLVRKVTHFALAKSPMLVAPKLNFVSAMTTTHKGLVAAALIIALGFGGALYEGMVRRDLEASAATISDSTSALKRMVRAAQQRADNLAYASRAVAVTASRLPTDRDQRDFEQAVAYMSAEKQRRAAEAFSLLRLAGASPQQIGQFEVLAAKDIPEANLPRGAGNQVVWRIMELNKEWPKTWEADLQALLGPEVFSRLQELQKAQQFVSEFSSYLTKLEIPFEPEHAKALLLFLAGHAELLPLPGAHLPADLARKSEQFLSPDESAAWRRMQSSASIEKFITAKLESLPLIR